MNKYAAATITVKLNQRQHDRLNELSQETGMTRPDVLRALIDNAVMVLRPVPGATLTIAPPVDSAK